MTGKHACVKGLFGSACWARMSAKSIAGQLKSKRLAKSRAKGCKQSARKRRSPVDPNPSACSLMVALKGRRQLCVCSMDHADPCKAGMLKSKKCSVFSC